MNPRTARSILKETFGYDELRVLQARGSTERAHAACQSAREHLVRRVGASHPYAQEADRLARTLST